MKSNYAKKFSKKMLIALLGSGMLCSAMTMPTMAANQVEHENELVEMMKSYSLRDGTFELGGSAWSVRNKGEVATGVSYDGGTKSGSVPSGNSSSFIGQNITVEKNTNYTISAYIKMDIADAHLFFGARPGGDGAGSPIKDVKVAPGNTDWNKVSLTFNSGENEQVLIQLVKWGDNSDSNLTSITNCRGYIDNVTIVKEGDTEEPEYEFIWADDFNGSTLNEDNWGYELGCVRGVEQQHYVKSEKNTFMRNGSLVLKATDRALEDQYKNPRGNRQVIYDSGSVRTHGKQEFLYGRIEMRARLPKGKGVFPAFWTLGSNFTLDGDISDKQGNPWSRCGEIDIMELTGKPLGDVGNKQAWGTPHFYYPGGDADKDSTGSGGKNYQISSDYNDDYHIFGVNWSPDKIEWYVDGVIYNTLDFSNPTWGKYAKMAYSQPQYIQFNLAMGGNWPGDAGTDLAGTEFDIDYVYYAQNAKQKAAAQAYYDEAPEISGLQDVVMTRGEIPDLLANVTSNRDSFVDFSVEDEHMFKNEGGLTNANRVCSGKDDAAKLATLPAGKYNIHYTAIPNNVEYIDNVPNREKEYKMTRRTVLLTVQDRVFPSDITLTGVYGEKLSTVALPEHWQWEQPNTVLTDPKMKYAVKYSQNGVETSEEISIQLVSADKTELSKLINKAEIYLQKDIYTDASIKTLKDGIANAQAIIDKNNATKKEVTEAIWNLNGVIAGLQEKPVQPPIVEEDKYSINEGAETTVTIGEEAAFRSNAPIEKFKEVILDGNVLDSKYYTVTEGSTIITLLPEFTKTLSKGEHKLIIVSLDGQASTTFSVESTSEQPSTPSKPSIDSNGSTVTKPSTGDTTNVMIWTVMALISGLSYAVVCKKRKIN